MVTLIVVLILVGVALYLVNTVIPMAPQIKTLINVVVTLVAVLFVLQAFGLLDGLNRLRVR